MPVTSGRQPNWSRRRMESKQAASGSEMLHETYRTSEGCWHWLEILSFDRGKCSLILHSHLSESSALLAGDHKSQNKLLN